MTFGSKLSVISLCCLVSHICIAPALSEMIPSYQGSAYGWVAPSYADTPTGLSPDYLGEPADGEAPTGIGSAYFGGPTGTAGQYPSSMGESVDRDGLIEMSADYGERPPSMEDPSGMASHFGNGPTGGDGGAGPHMDYMDNIFDKAGQHRSIAAPPNPMQISTPPYNTFNHQAVPFPQRRTKSRHVKLTTKALHPARASMNSRTADENLWEDMVNAIGTLAKNKTLELAQNNKLVNRKPRRHGKKRCSCRKKKGGRRMKSVPPTIPRSDLHKTHLSTLPMGQTTSSPYVEQSTEPSLEHVTTMQPTSTIASETTEITTTEQATTTTTTRPSTMTALVVTTTPAVVTTIPPTKPQDETEDAKTSLTTDSPKAVKKRRKCKRRRKKLGRRTTGRKPAEYGNDGGYVHDGSRHLLRMDLRSPVRVEELMEPKSLESGDLALVMD